jgi:uncharacterized protein (TIGR03437 family)
LSLASAATPYQTSVVVTCLAPAPCAGNKQTIGVSLTVTTLPPQLKTGLALLTFNGSSANPQASPQSLDIQNIGGGSMAITSITAADNWLTIGSFPAAISAGPATPVTVTANPSGLKPGFYQTAINIITSGGRATVHATLAISADSRMTLGAAGQLFNLSTGGTLGTTNSSFLVGVSSSAATTFAAQVLPGATWLSVTSGTGTALGIFPGAVRFAIDPTIAAGLTPQAYYGTIRVTAPGVVNSPQDFEVVLNVAPAASTTLPDPQPAGLLFIANAATPPAQTVQLFASSKTAVPYQTSASTSDGTAWLAVAPATGTTSAAAPAQSSISINLTGVKPGIYRGAVAYAYAGASVRSVNVTLIVQAALGTPALTGSLNPRVVCGPTQLVPTQTGLTSNFAAPASWPAPLAIRLVNDCGGAVTNGQVTATFSNGDPPLLLSLIDGNTGLYAGTWTPRNASSQVSIAARATAPGLTAATTQISGQVKPNTAPVLNSHGVLNVFSTQTGGALAPGTIVQIYGSGLASQSVSPPGLPLQTAFGGTSVIIGGIESPLFYISPGQINAQVPFDLPAGKQYQVIINANGALTAPETIDVIGAAPVLLSFVSGDIIAVHQAGDLVSDAAPAKPGEFLVLYAAGLGATDNAVNTGAASPGDPLARPLATPGLSLDGKPVAIGFSGLTPTLVGLYQVNFQVPVDARNGNLPLVITQGDATTGTLTLPVYQ